MFHFSLAHYLIAKIDNYQLHHFYTPFSLVSLPTGFLPSVSVTTIFTLLVNYTYLWY